MRRARVTLADVARRSGVSSATASFVLNRVTGQTIPEATQERVRRAAEELGYVPHGIARALREGTSRLVLLNVGQLPRRTSLEGFIDGLDEELTRLGHALLVRYGAPTPGGLRHVVDAAAPRAVLDIARLYASDDPDAHDGGWIAGLAAHTLTQISYLARRGHTTIGFVLPADQRFARLAQLRWEQARTAADALGLRAPVSFTVSADRAEARDRLRDFRHAHPAVTALAACDDDVAIRTLAALGDLGLSAPDDLAVIGFDDAEFAALWSPTLTSVRIQAVAYGRCAARHALGLDPGPLPRDPATVIERESA
ncbi:LacI family DNA-binding transcriptional regulator [Cryptosporangium aurantiacum]|uniref:DNA-binding transcriptional regulator, LacI/PurR family n=1 Tax=Cryptosporangium aurantiacum TaxID=134849 RepID=A0A1M7TTP7_9ACTN|nr:LacI family DNA-binding transcriptional regulator [Cryptosporangium aurantiacum]SHN74058.1 DNA-binding transcriptional regulator, LacI/PurR family [Cryptosporangium aurantiacum]